MGWLFAKSHDAHAVATLCQLVASKDARIVSRKLVGLSNLTGDRYNLLQGEDALSAQQRRGVVVAVLAALNEHEADVQVCNNALTVLLNVIAADQSRELCTAAIVEHKALPTVLKAVQRHDRHTLIQSEGLGLLYHLLWGCGRAREQDETQVLREVTRILARSVRVVVSKYCTGILFNLCLKRDVHVATLLEMKGLRVVLSAMGVDADDFALQRYCCGVLRRLLLIADTRARDDFVYDEGIKHLVGARQRFAPRDVSTGPCASLAHDTCAGLMILFSKRKHLKQTAARETPGPVLSAMHQCRTDLTVVRYCLQLVTVMSSHHDLKGRYAVQLIMSVMGTYSDHSEIQRLGTSALAAVFTVWALTFNNWIPNPTIWDSLVWLRQSGGERTVDFLLDMAVAHHAEYDVVTSAVTCVAKLCRMLDAYDVPSRAQAVKVCQVTTDTVHGSWDTPASDETQVRLRSSMYEVFRFIAKAYPDLHQMLIDTDVITSLVADLDNPFTSADRLLVENGLVLLDVLLSGRESLVLQATELGAPHTVARLLSLFGGKFNSYAIDLHGTRLLLRMRVIDAALVDANVDRYRLADLIAARSDDPIQ